jgi:hypothetical protein
MTFEEAVDIINTMRVPSKREEIIAMVDGKKQAVQAEIVDKLALYRSKRKWHLMHTLTGIAVYDCESYLEAVSLMNMIIDRQIDLCFTLRDIRVMRSILQVIGTRKEFILALPSDEPQA